MDCDDIMLMAAAGGRARTLSSTEEDQIEAHLARCTACQAVTGKTLPERRPPSAASGGAGDPIALPMVDPSVFTNRDVLARGGMGQVTRAHDRRLGRDVAIKEVLVPELRARFEREAMITARLQHPAIVPIYEAGTWPDGSVFYTMRLVTGGTLSDAIDKAGTLEGRLALLPHVIALTDALAYAHSRRVVHRDLKPSNVLVDELGETVVIDWGLAKQLGRDPAEDSVDIAAPAAPGLTRVGAVIGTPCYIAPEQAAGVAIDERADVYALGAILYQLLAGGPPYWDAVEHSADHLLAAARQRPPTPIHTLAPRAPADLKAIVDRAMARDPAARFPTAREMAEELHRFETGQLIRSREYRLRDLLVRRIHQHRAAVMVGAVAICMLAIGGVVSLREIVAGQAATQQAYDRSQRALEDVRRALADAELERGRQLVVDGDPAQGAAHLAAALTVLPEDRVGLQLAAIALRDRPRWRAALRGTAAAFRHDGRELAVARFDGTIDVIDPLTAHGPGAVPPLMTLRAAGGAIRDLAYSADDAWLAIATTNGAYLLDARTGMATRLLDAVASEVVFLPAGNRIAIASPDAVTVMDLMNLDGKPVKRAAGLAGPHRLAVSRDGAYLSAIVQDGATVWTTANLAPYRHVAIEHKEWFAATFGQDSVITAGMDGVRQWSKGTSPVTLSRDPAANLSWIDEDTLVADGTVVRGDVATRLGHASIEVSARIDASHVITGGFDHMIRIWDLRRASHPLVVLDAADATSVLQVDPTGRRAISRGEDAGAEIELWDIDHVYAPVHTADVGIWIDNLMAGGDRVAAQVGDQTLLLSAALDTLATLNGVPLAFRPRSHDLVLRHDGELWIHAGERGELRSELRCPDTVFRSDRAWNIAFSTHRSATVISCEHSVWLRDTDAARWRLVTRPRDARSISALAVDDHDRVVVGYRDGGLEILNASPEVATGATTPAEPDPGGRMLTSMRGHTATVNGLEIRDHTLVSMSWDQTLRRWDFPPSMPGAPVGPVLRSYNNAAISRDGTWTATVDGSAAVSLWDGETGRLLEQLPTADELTRVAFVDDHRLVVGSKHGHLELIDLSEQALSAGEVIRRVDESRRWRLVNGQVVQRPAFSP